MSKDRYAISSLNPHTHAGCDNRYKCNYTRRRVSIHTPTQGVTKLRLLCFGSSWFQSTHPRRVWPSCWLLCIILIKFQSTHPRRVWPNLATEISKADMFQSTHPRRVWPYKIIQRCKWNSFNPHTHAGCDYRRFRSTDKIKSFNPHTHAGCDPDNLDIHIPDLFQSTHPRRVWPKNL